MEVAPMMDPISLLIRFALGERLKKSTPQDRQWGAVCFLMIAVFFSLLLLGEKYEGSFLDRILNLGVFKLWVGAVIGMSIVVFGMVIWFQHVPPKLTISLAVLAWLFLLWMLFGLGWWDLDK